MASQPIPKDPEVLSNIWDQVNRDIEDREGVFETLENAEMLLGMMEEPPSWISFDDTTYFAYQNINNILVKKGLEFLNRERWYMKYVEQCSRLESRPLHQSLPNSCLAKLPYGFKKVVRELNKTYQYFDARLAPIVTLRDTLACKLGKPSVLASPTSAVKDQNLTNMQAGNGITSEEALDEVCKAQELLGTPEPLNEQLSRPFECDMLKAPLAPRNAGQTSYSLWLAQSYLPFLEKDPRRQALLKMLITAFIERNGEYFPTPEISKANKVLEVGKVRPSRLLARFPEKLRDVIEVRKKGRVTEYRLKPD